MRSVRDIGHHLMHTRIGEWIGAEPASRCRFVFHERIPRSAMNVMMVLRCSGPLT
jgi:hypothetical protein